MVWSPSKFYHIWLGNNVSICESTLAVCCVIIVRQCLPVNDADKDSIRLILTRACCALLLRSALASETCL